MDGHDEDFVPVSRLHQRNAASYKQNLSHCVVQQQHLVPPRSQLFNEDALLEVPNRLTDICQEGSLVLALLPLFAVCVQANTLALIRVETNGRGDFLSRCLSCVSIASSLYTLL